ncbi:S1C family serine protease, partial [Streptomyces oceani]
PVALLTGVAAVAALTGGGAGALVQGAFHEGGTGGTGNAAVSGTQTAADTDSVGEVVDAVSPSVVEINASSAAGTATGSGVVISEDGEILTNNHVVSGAERVKVTLSDGRTVGGEVVGTEPGLDMALVRAEASGLDPAELGSSEKVSVGDEVVAFGSPQGLTGTVTSGIVSAKDREVTVPRQGDAPRGQDGDWPFEYGGGEYNGGVGSDTTTYEALQTDAPLNPGNSGGPLVNRSGEVIGINSANSTATSGGGSIGLGFAVPVDDLRQILDELRAGGGQ